MNKILLNTQFLLLHFLKYFIFILAIGMLFVLYKDFNSPKGAEILPTTISAILLSLAAIAFSWSRVPVITDKTRVIIYLAAIDLFIGAVFSLIGLPMPWFGSFIEIQNSFPSIYFLLKIVHCLFFATALFLTGKALVKLINIVIMHLDNQY